MAKVSGTKYGKAKGENAHPKEHPLPLQGAANMRAGSDGMAHHPNGEHKATKK
jgi:hypothetical protein